MELKHLNFSLTDSTTYAGKQLTDLYSTLLLAGNTIKNIKVLPGIKDKAIIPNFNAGNVIQAKSGCAGTASGEGTLDDKTITVCPFEILLELCVTTFEQNYLSEQMKAGSNTGEVAPAAFVDYVVKEVLSKAGDGIERMFWQGNTTASPAASYPLNLCDGLEKKMLADGDVVDVNSTISPATVTSSNVLAELEKGFNLIPAAVYSQGTENLRIYMSSNVHRAYKMAQATNLAGGLFFKDQIDTFAGIPVILASGMSDNNYVIAHPDNLILGTDIASDLEALKVVPKNDYQDILVFKSNFKVGFEYFKGAEIVWYA